MSNRRRPQPRIVVRRIGLLRWCWSCTARRHRSRFRRLRWWQIPDQGIGYPTPAAAADAGRAHLAEHHPSPWTYVRLTIPIGDDCA